MGANRKGAGYRIVGTAIAALLGHTVFVFGNPHPEIDRPAFPSSLDTKTIDIRDVVSERNIAYGERAGPGPVIYNDASSQARSATTAGADAFVFKNDYDSGYGWFIDFRPTSGVHFPGAMIADEMVLGNGFDPSTDQISAYEIKVYRSPVDPSNGMTLATYHFELWDGDPFNSVWTVGDGYAGAKIPGTECTWTDIPGPLLATLHCDLPTPVSAPHDRVWGVLYGDDTCSSAWRISGRVPEIGDIIRAGDPPVGNDLFEYQRDDVSVFDHYGHCCRSGESCSGISGCPDDDVCGDTDADEAVISSFGGSCTNSPGDFCASFWANVYAPTDFTVTLQPTRSSGANNIIGNEIVMPAGGQQVWLDVMFENWQTPVKTWQAKIDPAGYGSGLVGTLTPYNPACTSDADCGSAMGSTASKCNDYSYPPGGCTPGYQDFSGDPTLDLGVNAVSLATLFFTYGSTTFSGSLAADPGGPHTGGQLALDVPGNADGTFTIGWVAPDTWMKDSDNYRIPLIGLVPAKITIADMPTRAPGEPGYPKNRYVSFVPNGQEPQTALRVTLVDMPSPFESDEGCRIWVGAPTAVSESSGDSGSTPPPTFMAAGLQVDSYCTDWSAIEVLHVYDDEIVPGALFEVQSIDCTLDPGVEANYSAPLGIRTGMWGDIGGSYAATYWAAPDDDIDFDDITMMVDKFKNVPGAPIKARGDIAPDMPDQIVDFEDIPQMVDAFRGLPYPFDGPDECP